MIQGIHKCTRKGQSDQGERGSAVIEAVLCLTIFISAIFFILSFINLCRAQAIVSNAVDATAKEMSQYAYFWHLTGLDKLDQGAAGEVEDDRKNLNNLIGGVDSLYSVFESTTSDEMMSEKQIEATLGSTQETGENGTVENIASEMKDKQVNPANLSEKMDELQAAYQEFGSPMEIIKSLGRIALVEGFSMIKSQLIAAPLASALMEKHFEVGGQSAGEYLSSLRIVVPDEGNPMSAFNLKLSTIFAPTSPDDIHIVAYYQVQAVNFFNFEFGTVTLCKESVTRAWLGGDIRASLTPSSEEEKSVWNLGSLQYGKYITEAEVKDLEKKDCLKASEKGVDAFEPNSNTWIAIHSMDIYSASYSDSENAIKNIKSALKKYYRDLTAAAETSDGTISVVVNGEKQERTSAAEDRKTKLILVIPNGAETAEFQEAFEQFQKEMKEGDSSFTIEYQQGYGKSPQDPSQISTQMETEQE